MKKFIYLLFSLLTICGSEGCLHGNETNQRAEDLRIILNKSFFDHDEILTMLAAGVLAEKKASIDSRLANQKFRELILEQEAFAKFLGGYADFSDEELHQVRQIYQIPAYQKFIERGRESAPATMVAVMDLFGKIVDQYDVVQEKAHSAILEITPENFEKEVVHSSLPLLIDVYSTSCPPCRAMEPILESLSQEYAARVRFLKINCDTQIALARKYKITALPTLLFIKPGTEVVYMKSTGFTAKEAVRAKIDELLKTEN